MARTERIHSLLPRLRPRPREQPPGCDEKDVALQRRHALELGRERVVVARAERRARGGVGGVELKQPRQVRARGVGEPVARDVVEELVVGPVSVRAGELPSDSFYQDGRAGLT